MRYKEEQAQIAVFLAEISFLEEEAAFHRGLSLVPAERQEAALRMKVPADQRRSLGAGLLLEYGLRKRGYSLHPERPETVCVHLAKGAYGKPYIAELPGFFFNLSHAGDYVAAVFADCAVGIDIEQTRDVKPDLARRFFTAEECAFLLREQEAKIPDSVRWMTRPDQPEVSGRDFLWLWTRKESYIKAVGEGMHLPLADFSVLDDLVRGEVDYLLHTWEPAAGYALSVCAASRAEVCVKELTPGKIFDGLM